MYDNGQDMQQDSAMTGNNESSEGIRSDEMRDDGSLIKAASDEEGKMFVGGLSWETNEENLREYFEKFGRVRDCVIKRDNESKRSRGFGFVLFCDPDSVNKVLAAGSHILDGRNIDPKRAKALRKDHKLFVGGLNPDTKEETIRKHFEQFGEIDTVERPIDRSTGKARGFCFITFIKDGVINDVITHSKFHQIDGRQCECKDGDPKKQAGRGRGRGQEANMGYSSAAMQSWGAGMQGPWNYDYNYTSGYGGYGSGYGGGYGGYGFPNSGYGGYGTGYGGYYPDMYSQQMTQQTQQNSGGKTKSAGRGGQNNYKPY